MLKLKFYTKFKLCVFQMFSKVFCIKYKVSSQNRLFLIMTLYRDIFKLNYKLDFIMELLHGIENKLHIYFTLTCPNL